MKERPGTRSIVKKVADRGFGLMWRVFGCLCPYSYNKISEYRYRGGLRRCLDIGPGNERIDGFETLSIIPGRNVDYVADASKRMPFRDGTFDLIYASHVLEHIPWYQVADTLREWVRILKSGGQLEVWVPDGLKVCKALVEAEEYGCDSTHLDGWYKFNPDKDPCVWAAGRLFTYGDGTGRMDHPNWHRAIFTLRYIKGLFEKTGLTEVRELTHEDVRGYDHGWINLGVRGVKP